MDKPEEKTKIDLIGDLELVALNVVMRAGHQVTQVSISEGNFGSLIDSRTQVNVILPFLNWLKTELMLSDGSEQNAKDIIANGSSAATYIFIIILQHLVQGSLPEKLSILDELIETLLSGVTQVLVDNSAEHISPSGKV